MTPGVRTLTSVLAILGEELGDLVTNFAIGKLDVVLGAAGILVHEGQETIVGNIELARSVYL